MRLGIMQPYFFPNLAHFALIATTDEWVVFDVTQYTRKSWMNRNRILHPTTGWHYVSVPLEKTTLDTKTCEARVANKDALHKSLRGKLSHYKKAAPYYQSVLRLVDRVFEGAADDSLVALNVSGLKEVCAKIDIPFSFQICSDMGLDFPGQMGPGDWAPLICRHLKADAYVNPAGGHALFDPAVFKAQATALHFADFPDFVYASPGYEFVPGLSILDVLMWNSPNAIRKAVFKNNKLGGGT